MVGLLNLHLATRAMPDRRAFGRNWRRERRRNGARTRRQDRARRSDLADTPPAFLISSANNLFSRANTIGAADKRVPAMVRPRKHGTRRLDRVPSTSGALARLAYNYAREAGIRVGPLLAKAGLTAEQLADRQARIKSRSQIRLLDIVAVALKDDLLGFHLGRSFDLREIGLLYYVMASSDELGDSIRRALRYSAIVNEGLVADLRAGREASVSVRYVGVERRHERHQIE